MRTRSQYYRREPRSSRTRHRAPPEDGQEEDLYIPSDSESEDEIQVDEKTKVQRVSHNFPFIKSYVLC